jgi:hypothetical protein
MNAHTIKGILMSMPWLAAGLFLWFFKFSELASIGTTLGYGVYKVCLAVILAWLADVSLNMGSTPALAAEKGNFMPEIRRAIYFLGIAWILSVS